MQCESALPEMFMLRDFDNVSTVIIYLITHPTVAQSNSFRSDRVSRCVILLSPNFFSVGSEIQTQGLIPKNTHAVEVVYPSVFPNRIFLRSCRAIKTQHNRNAQTLVERDVGACIFLKA